VPEALVVTLDEREKLAELIAIADAIVVGPGLEAADAAAELFDLVVEGASPRAVIVVDALAIPAVGRGRKALTTGDRQPS
jgi:NAD(P)H-hydrate repair Nnr-like enzyme with NAD(P)H-hydrate dehydratase domain